MVSKLWLILSAPLALTACPPPPGSTASGDTAAGGGGGANASAAIDPDACGQIDGNDAGRKLHAFLVASAELDRVTADLEHSVWESCRKMAVELGVTPVGSTKDLCTKVANALHDNLEVSVSHEKRLVTRTVPAECHTDITLSASFAAQCEGGAAANNNGAAASAECRAAGDVHAAANTVCTEPKVEVVQQDVTIVDATKFQAAVAAINAGLPQLLKVQKRLEIAGKSLEVWADSGTSFAGEIGGLVAQMGAQSLCVAGQVNNVVNQSTEVQGRLTVSVEVTASVSASAGAQ
ncbi:MAG TPA: hypothetical protein VGM90_20350 [Kofleriaceae bacterium]|jgi:hypothetical protein